MTSKVVAMTMQDAESMQMVLRLFNKASTLVSLPPGVGVHKILLDSAMVKPEVRNALLRRGFACTELGSGTLKVNRLVKK